MAFEMITLRVPKDLLDRVEQAAAEVGVRRSVWLRMALDRQLEAWQSERLTAQRVQQLVHDIGEMIAASQATLIQYIDETGAHHPWD